MLRGFATRAVKAGRELAVRPVVSTGKVHRFTSGRSINVEIAWLGSIHRFVISIGGLERGPGQDQVDKGRFFDLGQVSYDQCV